MSPIIQRTEATPIPPQGTVRTPRLVSNGYCRAGISPQVGPIRVSQKTATPHQAVGLCWAGTKGGMIYTPRGACGPSCLWAEGRALKAK